MTNELLTKRTLEEAMASPNEFCVGCYCDMGFSKHLHVDDPRRYENDGQYVQGSGQWCGPCVRSIVPSVS